MTWATALLARAPGAGFGLPCVYAIWHFAKRGQIWTSLGYPTCVEGLFETIGIKTCVPLLISLLLLSIEVVFWAAFLLPFGPLFGLAGTALVLTAWHGDARSARPSHGTRLLP